MDIMNTQFLKLSIRTIRFYSHTHVNSYFILISFWFRVCSLIKMDLRKRDSINLSGFESKAFVFLLRNLNVRVNIFESKGVRVKFMKICEIFAWCNR